MQIGLLLIASTLTQADETRSTQLSWLAAAKFRFDQQVNESASDQDLRKELLRRRDVEQKLRFKLIEGGDKLDQKLLHEAEAVDRENREWLKAIVDKKGWPGQAMVGFDGSDAAWLLAQHSDPDLPFQKRVLELIETALKKKDVRPVHVAYLTDRVRSNEGKKQVYGTQFTVVDGKHVPKPIEDEANVDRRRAEVGMSTLAEYQKQIEKMYGKKK